jgi:hypothetical protein
VICLAGTTLGPGPAAAGLTTADLEGERLVHESDWLRLQLKVLALELSYPAYRIQLDLNEKGAITFDFLASSGLAEHLSGDTTRAEAEKLVTYHATGIGDQVQQLLTREFPSLAPRFRTAEDLTGRFLAPGKAWDDPPRVLGTWADGRFTWSK